MIETLIAVNKNVYKNKEGQEYILEPFISEQLIRQRVRALGQEISRDYRDKKLTLVPALKGAIIFLADLAREISVDDLEMDLVELGSYGDGTSPGQLKITRNFDSAKLSGRDVLVVEDIADTGKSINVLKKMAMQNPDLKLASLKFVSFLSKPSRREVEVSIAYLGMEIPNEFVVGYGLDYQQKHRQLKDIRIVRFR